MASKTPLNAKNLETLGAARLANLLIEISTDSAVAKRRLRLELAGAQSPKEAGREVAKRLTSQEQHRLEEPQAARHRSAKSVPGYQGATSPWRPNRCAGTGLALYAGGNAAVRAVR
jgi:hypothetical protein